MITKKQNDITFIPPMRQDDHGWLNVDGDILLITNIHSFDDFGVEQDTLTLENGREYVTQDYGDTFWEN